MWNYRGLELSNGMLCVPISHPSIDMGAAALDISIGSLADPRDVPGIAHFLEHMLFMGSTKYPGENEYSKFAHFFISPLLSPSSIGRELQAVHSEFESYLGQDSWHIFQVDKLTSDPEHPYSRFTIGNMESLRTTSNLCGIDIRQVLIDFYENEYSANRMSLAVLGNRKLTNVCVIDVSSTVKLDFETVFVLLKHHDLQLDDLFCAGDNPKLTKQF
ncbi:unnamed protein product [Rotaria sordida]|uniref:Peptidase M16 N-terminal domain-containing protein n=1 Tax=Rotaria sordida TaxID=392033 RepID=A0A819JU34_9BILA|nr:unnamed protein product [Rotaria sordida]